MTMASTVALALGWRRRSGFRRGACLGWRPPGFVGAASGVHAYPGDVGFEGLAPVLMVVRPVGAGGAEASDGAEAEEHDEESAFHGVHR